MDRFGTALEIKSVDTSQRIISGFAAAGGLDRVGDVIDMSRAFTKTLSEKQPSDIAVFVAHRTNDLPVGIPVRIEATAQGLLTETKIFDGPAGDNLLAVARGLRENGQTLGLSIGYRIHPGGSEHKRVDGKSFRLLTSIDLHEYSFAARQTIANPDALMTGVKTEGEDGSPVDLPDSAYIWIQPGGELDAEGKTLPRSLRQFPYRDAEGKTDLAQLHAAIAAIPDADVKGVNRSALQARAYRLLEDASGAAIKTLPLAEPQWADGVALEISASAYDLRKIAEDIAEEQAAQRRLGEDTKQYRRIRPETRARIQGVIDQLTKQIGWAETIDAGAEQQAVLDRFQRELDLISIS